MEENGRIDMSRPTVEMKNIVKMFGSFKANDGINLTVHKGEIHAISVSYTHLTLPTICSV